jgi:hypothetical protein
VDRTTTPDRCWPWTGYCNPEGYGRLTVNGRTRYAHHIALELVGFIVPAEFLQVRHLCHNRPCCRHDHLKIGTPQDDTDDKVSAGRQARGERFPQSKLNTTKILEIRSLYAAGGITQEMLAQRYSVSQMVISRIVRGERWRHVEEEP